ncbi:MAG TPA: hypothetical protein VI027_11900 [Rubrobacteraceae bacterium]
MIRRMQLLGPQGRPYSRRLAAVGTSIRDDLLRDNKVVPAVLATLALLVFAWLVVGAFMGGGSNEEAANQVSLAQDEEEPDSGDAESPPSGVENRDTDSYSAFESKDPFRLLKGIESKDNKSGDNKSGDGKVDNGKAGDNRAGGGRAGDGTSGGGTSGNNGGDDARDNRDSVDQPLPGGSDFRGSQGGNGDLFSSGGDLVSP